MAPSVTPGDTVLATNSVSFGALPRSGDGPTFQPRVDKANVVIPAVKEATGGTGQATIEWEQSYLNAASAGTPSAMPPGSSPKSSGPRHWTSGAPSVRAGWSRRTCRSRALPIAWPIGGVASDMVGGKSIRPRSSRRQAPWRDPAQGHHRQLADQRRADRREQGPEARHRAEERPRRHDLYVGAQPVQLRPSDGSPPTLWIPHPGTTFRLKATVEKKLDTATPPEAKVEGKLTDFAVRLVPGTDLVELPSTRSASSQNPGRRPTSRSTWAASSSWESSPSSTGCRSSSRSTASRIRRTCAWSRAPSRAPSWGSRSASRRSASGS